MSNTGRHGTQPTRAGRTLIVQPLPGIGDMVWHLPHIQAIAATTESGRVDILTKPRSQADRLLIAERSVERILWLERSSNHAGMRGLWRLAALLRRGHYQRVWILHGSTRYALAAWLAGIPQRIGYGVGGQRYFLNHNARLPTAYRHAHPTLRATALLDALHIPIHAAEPHLSVCPNAQRSIYQRFAAVPQPWIALGIGSSEPYKQWGAPRFADLALELPHSIVGAVFIVGGPNERALANEILHLVKQGGGTAWDAVDLPLEQTAALLAQCRGFIGNDTGVLNMAAALKIPSLGLFGGSPPLTHSQFIHAVIPQSGQSGMESIHVNQVLDACRTWQHQ